jgi:adenylate cyclase
MADEGFERKLAAILSADVEGYSRLMDDDEEATVRTLTSYRTTISNLVQKYGGRVVDSPGDNILAEFKSVVDAVNCAVEIHRDIAGQNAELPNERKMQFRIGVNLGDVIEEEDRIYGAGVNIAARLEGLADVAGICISGTAFDQVKGKLPLGYQFVGEQTVKNISDPVRAYKVLMDEKDAGKLIGVEKKASNKRWIWVAAAAVAVVVAGLGIWQFYSRPPSVEPATEEKMAYPLPDKPSIAVLAFDNLSGEPEQEYFCDGLSEGIINGLAKNDRLFVIARNSTFTYKGKPTKVKQIAEDLGVRYVLEGSIQKAGDRVRVTAQLIDALSGYHLFSERYDRELKDILKLQDEITKKVLTAVQVKLTSGEGALAHEKGTDNLDAYLKVMQAREYKSAAINKERVLKAMQLLKEAIALDPEYASAYSFLSTVHFDLVVLGASDSPGESLRTAIELGNKAVALDESNPSVHANLVYPYIFLKKFDKAFSEAEKSVSIAPNYAAGYFALGFALVNTGRYQEAIPVLQKCLRLSPIPVASNVLTLLANSYISLGQYEEAITVYKRILHIYGQDHLFARVGLARSYVLINREKEARAEAAEVMKIDPDFSIIRFLKPWPISQERKDQIAADLRKAGLPDEPSLPLPDKPSIAVLAFDNLSGDPEQEYFSDGIAENIITALSKVGELFVIARNSSFTYKGKPVKVQQVSRELGVRYVLEGSVQKSGDRVRITAQLIDAKSGQHLWAEKYDRELRDIFEIQDEITKRIVTSLRIKLSEGEQARLFEKQTKTLDGYLKFAQALSFWRNPTEENIIRFGQLGQEIVDMEPESPNGYRILGWYHWMLAMLGKAPRESIKKSLKFFQEALSRDESDAWSHAGLGSLYLILRKYEKAIESGKRAVELAPNGAMVHQNFGLILSYTEHLDEAIAHLKHAIRLNPFPAYYYYYNLGRCYRDKGQYEDALTEFRKGLQRDPNSHVNYLGLAIIYVLLERQEEAEDAAKKVIEIFPNWTIKSASTAMPYKNKADFKLIVDAMRKAGLPE